MRILSRWAACLTCLFGVIGGIPVYADLPLAKLTTVFPMGGKRGTSVEVTIAGTDLEGATSLLFSRPGITATPIDATKFKVDVAADALLGLVDVRVVGTFGVSNPRTFVIDDLAEVVETQPNNTPAEAKDVAFGSMVNGRIDARADVDYYSFDVPQGTRVVLDCFAERIDSRLNGVLTLFSPSGRRIAVARAYHGKDPRLDFVVHEPGKHIVRIADLTFDGSAEYFYRLAIHGRPIVDFAYPPLAHAGTKEKVTLYGRNLPGGKLREAMVDVVAKSSSTPSGSIDPLEMLEVEIEAPSDPGTVLGLASDLYLRPTQAHIDGFTHRLALPDGGSLPVFIGFAEHPIALESEPNNSESSPQVISLPAEIVGRCDTTGDEDWYRFPLKKDESIEIEGFAERSGFPSDLTFLLRKVLPADPAQPGVVRAEDIGEYDDNGTNVGRFKCDSSTHDPITAFRAPADGDYLLSVRDRFNTSRGDQRYVYHVSIHPAKPDFRLMVSAADEVNPSSLILRKGGTAFVNVFSLRHGGFAGEITVDAVDLPPGLTAPPVILGASVNEVPLVFTAAADAAEFTGPITIRGTATLNGQPIVRVARACTITWPGSGTAPMPSRLSRGFYAAIRGDAPYLLTAVPDKITIGQGTQLTLSLNLQRHWKDFVGKMDGITALNLPPNVDNQAVAIGDNGTAVPIHLLFKRDVPPGTYSFTLRGTAQVPYGKTPEAKKENVAVADPTPPVTVTVVPRPVELNAEPKAPMIKVGTGIPVKVAVNRINNFAGPVKLELTVPPGVAGISAAPIEVPPDQKEATLTINVAADVPPGDKTNVTVRGTATVGAQVVTVDDVLVLKVTQ